MTPERMRVVVAGLCGWTDVTFYPDENQHDGFNPNGKWDRLPDYPNDLNAMNEAEKGLNQFQAVHYPEILFEVVTQKKWDGDMGYFMPQFTRATAHQRCEAFIRTHNKWEES